MIDAKELRIGNYVVLNQYLSMGGECPEMILVIDLIEEIIKDFACLSKVGSADWFDIHPVLLTEEWLLNLGFINTMQGFNKGKIYIKKTPNNIFWLYLMGLDKKFCPSLIDFNLEIKYVNQLQNICFYLIGEELTLK